MGRPRKKGVKRDAKGKSRGEPVSCIKAVVLKQRKKDVGEKYMNEPMVSFSLGRYYVSGLLTSQQFTCGEHLAQVVRRHRALISSPPAEVRAAALERSGGHSTASQPGAEQVERVRADYARCLASLLGQGPSVLNTCIEVCVDCRPGDVEQLRAGLDALGRDR